MKVRNSFNVLSPEVDIDSYNVIKKNSRKPKPPAAPATSNAKPVKKDAKSVPKDAKSAPKDAKSAPKDAKSAPKEAHPKKKNHINDDLQNMAFNTRPKKMRNKQGGPAPEPSSVPVPSQPSGKKSKKKANAKEEWNKTDNEYVSNVNNKNLEHAILLSKLEQGKKLANGPSEEKENSKPKELVESKNKKKKKKQATTISLDEFQRATPAELTKKEKAPSNTTNVDVPKKKNKKPKEKFFEEVQATTKSTILREKQQEHYKKILKIEDRKAMENKFSAEVEKRDYEIQALGLEVASLKTELTNVKQRNKKLCEVIGCSEMKPKGELVVQLAKASKTRDEYSEEVSKLSAELEQEKTKVNNLSQEIKKLQVL